MTGSIAKSPLINSRVDVHLVSEDYNPFDSTTGNVYTTEADNSGKYQFNEIPYNNYYLFANDQDQKHVLLKGPFDIKTEQTVFETSTLEQSSVITLFHKDTSDDYSGLFFIKGVPTVSISRNDSEHVSILSHVPSGVLDIMYYPFSSELKKTPIYFSDKVTILPHDSIVIHFKNRPPRVTGSALFLPDSIKTDTTYRVLFKAVDPDSQDVVYALETRLVSYTFDSIHGELSWTPDTSELNLTQIIIKVSDNKGSYSRFQWNFAFSSENSAAKQITVPPQIYTLYDTVFTGEPIFLVAHPESCALSSFFKFFMNGEICSNWSQRCTTIVTLDLEGVYIFKVSGWCDTARYRPSELSKPCTVTVVPFTEPYLRGDTTYSSSHSVILPFTIYDTVSQNKPVLHRVAITSDTQSAGTTGLGYTLLTDTTVCFPEDTC